MHHAATRQLIVGNAEDSGMNKETNICPYGASGLEGLNQELANVFVKSQITNIFGFVGHMIFTAVNSALVVQKQS